MGCETAVGTAEKLLAGTVSGDGQLGCPLTPSQRQQLRDRYAAGHEHNDVIRLLDYLGWVETELLRVSQRSEEMKSRLTRTASRATMMRWPTAAVR